jgi:hypothetical protein
MYPVYTVHNSILYRSVRSPMVQSHTIQEEVVNTLTPKKYTILKGNFAFNLRDVFQKHNHGVKQDLPISSDITFKKSVFFPYD